MIIILQIPCQYTLYIDPSETANILLEEGLRWRCLTDGPQPCLGAADIEFLEKSSFIFIYCVSPVLVGSEGVENFPQTLVMDEFGHTAYNIA